MTELIDVWKTYLAVLDQQRAFSYTSDKKKFQQVVPVKTVRIAKALNCSHDRAVAWLTQAERIGFVYRTSYNSDWLAIPIEKAIKIRY